MWPPIMDRWPLPGSTGLMSRHDRAQSSTLWVDQRETVRRTSTAHGIYTRAWTVNSICFGDNVISETERGGNLLLDARPNCLYMAGHPATPLLTACHNMGFSLSPRPVVAKFEQSAGRLRPLSSRLSGARSFDRPRISLYSQTKIARKRNVATCHNNGRCLVTVQSTPASIFGYPGDVIQQKVGSLGYTLR